MLTNDIKINYILLINKAIGFFRRLAIKLKVKSILEKNFKENKPFSFVQVGANDGVSFDFLYDFVQQRKSKGIVIEPVKEYFDELVRNYSKFDEIEKVNKAIHPTEKSLKIYKINPNSKDKYPDWVKGIASFDPNHHTKLNIETKDIISEIVHCDTLQNIVKNNEIDFFQIDTEGFDYEVLKMINFDTLKPKIIKYEHASLSKEDINSAKNLLKTKGYYLFLEFNDTIAVDINRIHL